MYIEFSSKIHNIAWHRIYVFSLVSQPVSTILETNILILCLRWYFWRALFHKNWCFCRRWIVKFRQKCFSAPEYLRSFSFSHLIVKVTLWMQFFHFGFFPSERWMETREVRSAHDTHQYVVNSAFILIGFIHVFFRSFNQKNHFTIK